jgi:hypothetical protein
MCGINTPARPFRFPHRLLHAHRPSPRFRCNTLWRAVCPPHVAEGRRPAPGGRAAPPGSGAGAGALTRSLWASPPQPPSGPSRRGPARGPDPAGGAVAAHGAGPRCQRARGGGSGALRLAAVAPGVAGRPASGVRGKRWSTSACIAWHRVASSRPRARRVRTGSRGRLKAGTRANRCSGAAHARHRGLPPASAQAAVPAMTRREKGVAPKSRTTSWCNNGANEADLVAICIGYGRVTQSRTSAGRKIKGVGWP